MRYRVLLVVVMILAGRLVTAQENPPGEIYTVNGHALHLYCIGNGSPTIILEAGVGGFTLNWTAVQPELAENQRVCSYDRRGYGWSDPLTDAFSLDTAVDDLHALLVTATVEPPYVFVGHSFGGVLSRAYHAAHPDEVIGMVFLDAIHPQLPVELEMYPPALRRQLEQLDMAAAMLRVFAESDGEMALVDAFVPDDASSLYLDKMLEDKFLATSRAEALYMVEDMPNADLPVTLGDMPLIVVRHGITETRSFLGAAMTTENAVVAEEIWQTLQADLATLSTQGRLVVAEESAHSIQFDQPDLVIDLVREVVAVATA